MPPPRLIHYRKTVAAQYQVLCGHESLVCQREQGSLWFMPKSSKMPDFEPLPKQHSNSNNLLCFYSYLDHLHLKGCALNR
jgi:hypothetical protein